ncbi:MAG: hypothetical protein GKR87_00175 [Kiritimatiellae bacterium]|nr:hypothetical protein [Kiritimatiellia bacterium]
MWEALPCGDFCRWKPPSICPHQPLAKPHTTIDLYLGATFFDIKEPAGTPQFVKDLTGVTHPVIGGDVFRFHAQAGHFPNEEVADIEYFSGGDKFIGFNNTFPFLFGQDLIKLSAFNHVKAVW